MAASILVALLSAGIPNDVSPTPEGSSRLWGTYRWDAGGFVDVFGWDELGPGSLVAFDDQGWVRLLTPAGDGAFTAGRSVAVPEPVAARLRFEPAEGPAPARTLVWEAEGQPPRVAQRVEDHRAQEVSFANGDTRLAFRYSRTGAGWDDYATALARSRDRSWLPYLRLPTDREDGLWEQQRLFFHYDPAPAFRALRCPVLALSAGRTRASRPRGIAAAGRRAWPKADTASIPSSSSLRPTTSCSKRLAGACSRSRASSASYPSTGRSCSTGSANDSGYERRAGQACRRGSGL